MLCEGPASSQRLGRLDPVGVVWTSGARQDLASLRRKGHGALAASAVAFVQRLDANPQNHRLEGIQRSIDGGQGWARTLRVGGTMCVVGWTVDANGDLVILGVQHYQ